MEIQYALYLQSHEADDLFEQTESRAKSPGSDANADQPRPQRDVPRHTRNSILRKKSNQSAWGRG